MKFRSLVVALVFLSPLASNAQYDNRQNPQNNGRGGQGQGGAGYARHEWHEEQSTLTVYSENGELFYLILNGVNQNSVPQARLRVEGLPKYGNDVQILFTDNRTPRIKKMVNIADPVDSKSVDMVLKVARGRDGFPKLKFVRCNERVREYHPERGEYIMNYGNPQQITSYSSYVDPNTGQTVTQTTVTETTNGGGYNNGGNGYNAPPPPPPAPVAMDPNSFNDAKQTINNASFEDTKMSTAKTIFGVNYLTTNQITEICNLFSFEDTKLAFAKFAYPRCVDPGTYYKIANIFSFDASRQSLNDFISKQR